MAPSQERPGLAALWTGTLMGPLAWFANLELSLAYTRTAVATNRKWPLLVFAAVALGLALVGAVMSHRHRRRLGALVERGESALEGARSVAVWGLGLALFSALLIVASAVAPIVFHPRDLA
jgi:hypothetical protein